MNTTFRNEKSKSGLALDVIKSGLQKSIRRGKVEHALNFAREFYSFTEAGEGGKRIITNFRHRIMIILLEDVCNLSLVCLVDEALRKPLVPEKLIQIIECLCKSTKSRICSHVRAVFDPQNKIPSLMAEFPAIVQMWKEISLIDYSTFEEKCHWFVHFLNAQNIWCVFFAFQIAATGVKKPARVIFDQLSDVAGYTVLKEWFFKELYSTKEGFLCWLVLLLRKLNQIPCGEMITPTICDWPQNDIIIDDYILDKHTRFGKSRQDFATVGAFVENEAQFTKPEWKRFYELVRDRQVQKQIVCTASETTASETTASETTARCESATTASETTARCESATTASETTARCESATTASETTAFKFVVRAQLTTSKHKMDVYFARDHDKLVVVKGPYASADKPNLVQKFAKWKEENGLPFLKSAIIQMKPDRWPDGVPLGARNQILRNKVANFLIFESQIALDNIVTRMHSSKLWPPTEVVDWSQLDFHFNLNIKNATETEMIDFVHALLFRFIFGISDLAGRNFIRVNGRVISIDEDIEMRPVDFKKVRAPLVLIWLKQNYSKLSINRWTVPPEFNVKLTVIQNFDSCCALFSA